MNKLLFSTIWTLLAMWTFLACQPEERREGTPPEEKLFSRVPSSQSGITFQNTLTLSPELDVFRYRNYYNGGGVAIGDINQDSLPDVFLTSNMKENKLYLNKGDFQFEDITKKANIIKSKVWSTGVSMADVNGDGLLDIYICNSGDVMGGKRENELYINQGNLAFEEQAEAYGLADKGFSTHAAFFDYDQDGDLDCYVLNNSFRPVSSLGMTNIRHERDSTGGDKLYRNDAGRFTDVSQEAGIFGSVIGFGLGVTVTDVNSDTWQDIYISNDFFERDYLYINQQDGTFRDELPQRMGHISQFSMGTDAADLNNDGAPEIFVTDMLPETEHRLKTMVNFEDYDLYRLRLTHNYYEQYMRNTLQLNSGEGHFQEIGQYAGVAATDWSWGALIADFDNDRNKEIFVTNGIERDLINQDFINYLASDETLMATMRKGKADFNSLVAKMPSTKLPNYLFKQEGDLRFRNVAENWGLAEESFSNGAAYGDLDGDGDLDLVVNQLQEEAAVYRNNAEKGEKQHFLKISLQGPEKNSFGVGARVYAFVGEEVLMLENIPTKGFQSSMDNTLLFGLGGAATVDSLLVDWGYGKQQRLQNIEVNQHLRLDFKAAEEAGASRNPTAGQLFSSLPQTGMRPHRENEYIDFNRERLIYHMLSKEGPALAAGDVNGDGLDDMYLGGASGQAGKLYLQKEEGQFQEMSQPAFEKDGAYEDVRARFFDADGDGNLDLYVLSGGNEMVSQTQLLQDRLYINSGKGRFDYCESCLPTFYAMGSTVKEADYDKDGDLDLFVGGRAVPGRYGLPAASFLLENDGKGHFSNVTARVSPSLGDFGMLTDASWVDVDEDDDLDLVAVGDWSPVTIFKNNGANLERLYNTPGLEQSEGWWRTVLAADLDGDGHQDFVVGNWGLNSQFTASAEAPLSLYIADFDNNQTLDPIYARTREGVEYPFVLRHDLVKQLPYLKKKYTTYEAYAGQSVEDIFGEQLQQAIKRQAFTLESSVIWNNGDGSYTQQALPAEAQLAPVQSLLLHDFNGDGQAELLLSGNFEGTKPEEGRYDTNRGLLLKVGPEDRQFKLMPAAETGLKVKGVVNQAAVLQGKNQKIVVFGRNNDKPEVYAF